MAGTLTYLKGQGLPQRLEQYLHLLRTLREHIEEREREFLEPDCLLDVSPKTPPRVCLSIFSPACGIPICCQAKYCGHHPSY